MHLTSLKIHRMPGFKDRGFRYPEGTFKPGINLILGRNGSGKTSSCLAIRRLLWPEHSSVRDLAPVALESRWGDLEIVVEGSQHRVSHPLLIPPLQYAHCYTLLLDDLFNALDEDFALMVSKMAYGGSDLEKLRSQFKVSSRHGLHEEKIYFEKKKQLEDLAIQHRHLLQEELSLEKLNQEIQLSKEAKEKLVKIEIKRKRERLLSKLAYVREELQKLPEGAPYAKSEDFAAAQKILEKKELLLLELDEEKILAFEKAVWELETVEKEIKAYEMRFAELKAERDFLRGIDLPDFSVSNVRQIFQKWEAWQEAFCESKEWGAQLKTRQGAQEPLFSVELLLEGRRLLTLFFQHERWKLLRKLLLAVPLFGFAFYTVPIVGALWVLLSLTVLVMTRDISRKNYEQLGLPLPESWNLPSVRILLKQLDEMAAAALRFYKDKEAALEIATRKQNCDAILENLEADLHSLGFNRDDYALIPFLREAIKAQEVALALEKERALFEAARKRQESLISELKVTTATEAALRLRHFRLALQLQLQKQEILARCKLESLDLKLLSACIEQRQYHAQLTEERIGIEAQLNELGEVEEVFEEEPLLQERAAAFDSLILKRAQIITALEQVKKQDNFEKANEAFKLAEEALKASGEEFLYKVLGEFLLERVEKLFESEFQPEVFKRARFWFTCFTKGVYDLRLEPKKGFLAYEMRQEEAKTLNALSRGTRVQLILAVRLAFMESVEGEGQQLPLFLDEAMSHADDERFAYMVQALLEIAKQGRQIFYFTCQKSSLEAWQSAAPGKTHLIDLDEIKKESSAKEFPFIARLPLLPPAPEGKTLEEYAKELKLQGLSLKEPVFEWHLAHFVDSSEELYSLLLKNLHRYGQFKNLSEKGMVYDPRIAAKGILAEEFYRLSCIGKGRKVTWEDLEKGGVSDKFLDKVFLCAKEENFEAKGLLKALENRAVLNFRSAAREELARYLQECGCLDPRPSLTQEEILASLWQISSISNVFQKLEFQNSRRLKFEEAKPTSKQRLWMHSCDADAFKVQDAGAAENQFLKHVPYTLSQEETALFLQKMVLSQGILNLN
jgi:energy-coupling factor transporter ATP-binding protein EcfA2